MMKFAVAIALTFGLAGFAMATDTVTVIRQVKVEPKVQVQVVRVEQKVQAQVKVVRVENRRVEVEEVTEVRNRRVGPIRGFFRGLFGVDDEVKTVRTVRTVR